MSPPQDRLPRQLPASWYRIESSDALSSGDVRPVAAFDRRWVLYRTASGAPVLADAYCPHLGAHLGHGGRIEGELIRCPFHGWGFEPSGRCASIPYSDRVPAGAGTRPRPLVEHSGRIWAWLDLADRPPFFEIPEIPEETDPTWETIGRREWVIRSAVEELCENGADAAHFRFVHDMRTVPELALRFDGASLRSTTDTVFPAANGGIFDERIETRSVGLGCDVMRYSGRLELVEVVCKTPIDFERVRVEMTYRARRNHSPEAAQTARRVRDYLVWQFEKDIPIWENKLYRERPALCEGDGPIAEFRKWCEQFHPDRD